MSAIVGRIERIEPHPDADRLELMRINYGEGEVTLVSGPHYREGALGVYISPGSLVPGWLATHELEGLWLRGRGSEKEWCLVETKNMRGIQSPGVWAGSEFQTARNRAWRRWTLWQDHWKVGDDVTGYLGVRDPDRYDALMARASVLAAEQQAQHPNQRYIGVAMPAWMLVTDENGVPVPPGVN